MFRELRLTVLLITACFSLYGGDADIRELESRLENTQGINEIIKIYNTLAMEYIYFNTEKSMAYADKAMKLNKKQDTEEYIKSLLILGYGENIRSPYVISNSIVSAVNLLNIQEGVPADLSAFSYYLAGTAYINTADKVKAFDYLLKALTYYEELNNEEMYNMASNSFSLLNIYLEKYDEAETAMLQSVKFYQSKKLYKKQALTLKNLARLYEIKGDMVRAEKYYRQAHEIAINNYRLLIAHMTNALGNFYINTARLNVALELYREFFTHSEYITPSEEMASIYNNLARVYVLKEDYQNAIDYSRRILDMNIDNTYLINYSTYNLGYIYLQKKEYTLSQNYLMLTWNNIKNDPYTKLTQDNFNTLAALYEWKKLYREANKINILHKEMVLKQLNTTSYQKLLKAESKLRIDNKEKEMKTAEEQQRMKFQGMLIIFFLLLIILAGIILQLRLVYREKKIFEQLSRTDYLTQIWNRRSFMDKAAEEIIRFQRYKKEFIIILSDVDNFKSFNDKYGHDCGDEILIRTAQILKDTCRKIDIVARWGGEEFIMLLPSTGMLGAGVLAERFRKNISEMVYPYNDMELHITMTFGYARYNGELNLDECIKQADRALIHGKNSGKNRVVNYDDLEQ